MIRNDSEYRKAVARTKAESGRIEQMRKVLIAEELEPEEVKRALDPMVSFHLQLVEETEAYEQLKKANLMA